MKNLLLVVPFTLILGACASGGSGMSAGGAPKMVAVVAPTKVSTAPPATPTPASTSAPAPSTPSTPSAPPPTVTVTPTVVDPVVVIPATPDIAFNLLGTPSVDKTASSLASGYDLKDIVEAHQNGWKGQTTSSYVRFPLLAGDAAFSNRVEQLLPAREYSNGAPNLMFSDLNYYGWVTRGNTSQSTSTPAIAVSGTAFGAATVRSTTLNAYNIIDLNTNTYTSAPFTSAVNCTFFCSEKGNLVAYLTASAGIIMSKFQGLSTDQIAKNMDQSRDASGAFSLNMALSPKALK